MSNLSMFNVLHECFIINIQLVLLKTIHIINQIIIYLFYFTVVPKSVEIYCSLLLLYFNDSIFIQIPQNF